MSRNRPALREARRLESLAEAVRLLFTAVEALAGKVDRLAAAPTMLPTPAECSAPAVEPAATTAEPEAAPDLKRWTAARVALCCKLHDQGATSAAIAAALTALPGPPVDARLVANWWFAVGKYKSNAAPKPAAAPGSETLRWTEARVKLFNQLHAEGMRAGPIATRLNDLPGPEVDRRHVTARFQQTRRHPTRHQVLPAPEPEASPHQTVAEAIKLGREDVYVPGLDQRVPTARPGSAWLASPTVPSAQDIAIVEGVNRRIAADQRGRRVNDVVLDATPAALRAEAVAQETAPADADTILAWGRRNGAAHAAITTEALAAINALRDQFQLTPFRLVANPLGRIPQHELDRMASQGEVPVAPAARVPGGAQTYTKGIYGAPARR